MLKTVALNIPTIRKSKPTVGVDSGRTVTRAEVGINLLQAPVTRLSREVSSRMEEI